MSLAVQIAPHLPFLRRYARALTGTQGAGDALVGSTLEAIVAAPTGFPREVAPRLGLYRMFQALWMSIRTEPARPAQEPGTDFEATANSRLAAIPSLARQALLLSAMEGFTVSDVAYLINRTPSQVEALVAEAMAEIERQTVAQVMIIEDEPLIAINLEMIVRDLGHGVTGIATTHAEALALFRTTEPALVLADIQLADASSGIDAVKDILAQQAIPVIFITAFPERLLTGERPEPTFLIPKPFQTAAVQAAISQALFFKSTKALTV